MRHFVHAVLQFFWRLPMFRFEEGTKCLKHQFRKTIRLFFKSIVDLSRNKKGSKCLFNDALNTFYLRLYGVRHMVNDHSDSEKGNPLPPHRQLLSINRKGLYAPSHRQDNTYHGLCFTSRGALAGTRNSSMGPPHEGSIRRPIAPWANALTTELHLALIAQ